MAKSVVRSSKREALATTRAVSKLVKDGKTPLEAGATHDSFKNVISRTGYGTDNQSSYGGYGYSPLTNNRMMLDLAYRSSWVCRAVIQGRAKDMTRAGIDFESDLDPNDADRLHRLLDAKVWRSLRRAIQWARLYGGAGGFLMIDGQKSDTPLDIERIGKDDFKGLLPLDRWLLNPSNEDLVTDLGSPDLGKPKYYTTVADTPLRPNTKIHHTRFIRFEGDDLPYYQSLSTMLWGMSVLEPVWDRLLAFDSTTSGIAQMVYRASIRNMYIENWKETVAAGGKRLNAQLEAIDWMRRMQGNEGIGIFDTTDRFESLQFAFTGLDAVLIQMGQQLAGATRYPLTILFGQSPVGFNATGDSDTRMYYDSINTDQNDVVKPGLTSIIRVAAASEGIKIADDFQYKFNPLWQLTDEQKSATASQNAGTIGQVFSEGIIDKATALKELKQQSRETGIFTNITEEQIKDAEQEPPIPGMGMGGDPSLGGGIGAEPSPEPGAAFLPGVSSPVPPGSGTPPQGSNFLPKGGKSFLPKGTDGNGAFEVGETERLDHTSHNPLLHIHHPQGTKHGMLRLHLDDKNLPGRETQFAGHRVVVEVERGQKRSTGSSGGAVMAAPYGYFPNTKGNDGDCVDVFLGDNPQSDKVFIIDQIDPDSGEFHQHKVLIGFDSEPMVLHTFHAFYADSRGSDRLGKVKQLTLAQFSPWLERYRIPHQTLAV